MKPQLPETSILNDLNSVLDRLIVCDRMATFQESKSWAVFCKPSTSKQTPEGDFIASLQVLPRAPESQGNLPSIIRLRSEETGQAYDAERTTGEMGGGGIFRAVVPCGYLSANIPPSANSGETSPPQKSVSDNKISPACFRKLPKPRIAAKTGAYAAASDDRNTEQKPIEGEVTVAGIPCDIEFMHLSDEQCTVLLIPKESNEFPGLLILEPTEKRLKTVYLKRLKNGSYRGIIDTNLTTAVYTEYFFPFQTNPA